MTESDEIQRNNEYRKIIMALLILSEYGRNLVSTKPEETDTYPDKIHYAADKARAKFIAEQQGRIRVILTNIGTADFQYSLNKLADALNNQKTYIKLGVLKPIITNAYRPPTYGPN